MPRSTQKYLQDFIPKLKKTTPHVQFSTNNPFSSSLNRLILGCKYPKTLMDVDGDQSKGHGSKRHDQAATLSDIDRFLFENFKSLYPKDEDAETKKREEDENPDAIFFESPRFIEPPVNICSSHRFFIASGGSSSLMEEARASLTTSSKEVGSSYSTSTTIVDGSSLSSSSSSNNVREVSARHNCIAVLKTSQNPYLDFRLSMQEMVEARRQHAKIDWDFMEELLFCYLNLNDKESRKYILPAFVDQINFLRQNSERVSPKFERRRERRRR